MSIWEQIQDNRWDRVDRRIRRPLQRGNADGGQTSDCC